MGNTEGKSAGAAPLRAASKGPMTFSRAKDIHKAVPPPSSPDDQVATIDMKLRKLGLPDDSLYLGADETWAQAVTRKIAQLKAVIAALPDEQLQASVAANGGDPRSVASREDLQTFLNWLLDRDFWRIAASEHPNAVRVARLEGALTKVRETFSEIRGFGQTVLEDCGCALEPMQDGVERINAGWTKLKKDIVTAEAETAAAMEIVSGIRPYQRIAAAAYIRWQKEGPGKALIADVDKAAARNQEAVSEEDTDRIFEETKVFLDKLTSLKNHIEADFIAAARVLFPEILNSPSEEFGKLSAEMKSKGMKMIT